MASLNGDIKRPERATLPQPAPFTKTESPGPTVTEEKKDIRVSQAVSNETYNAANLYASAGLRSKTTPS